MEDLHFLRRILVVRTDRMGDLLLSLPAIQALRQRFPKAEIHLLLKKDWIPLLHGHPALNRLHPWEDRWVLGWVGVFRFSLWLFRQRFDAVVILNPMKLFHIASFLAGIPIRVGYRRKCGWLLTHSILDTKAGRNLHETEYNLELVALLGAHLSSGIRVGFPEHPEFKQRIRDLLKAHGVPPFAQPIALHPFSTHPAKNLPITFFWTVANQLYESGNTVLLIGTPSPEAAGLPPPPGCVNLISKIPLALLPELLRACAVLVSNDSGPVHIADAVGTPTVVVAPMDHALPLARWRPLGDIHTLLLDPTTEEAFNAIQRWRGHNRCGSSSPTPLG